MTQTKRVRSRRGDGEQLAEEIVVAARDLLAAAGSSEAVSIRKVADAVGVTPPSIYLHFADKWALLEAVVCAVFADLDAAMLAAAEGLTDPMAVLCAYGLAYVEFAVEHPEHYRLATMERHVELDEMGPVDRVLADAAFSHMVEAVQRCVELGLFGSGEALDIALELWATAHGLASLMITKPFLPWGEREALTTRVLGSVAMGRAVIGHHGGEMTAEEGHAWIRQQWQH